MRWHEEKRYVCLIILGSLLIGLTAGVALGGRFLPTEKRSDVIQMRNGDSVVLVAGRAVINVVMMDDKSRLPAQVTMTTMVDRSVDSSWELFADSHIRRTISRPDPKRPGEFTEMIDSDGDGVFESAFPASK